MTHRENSLSVTLTKAQWAEVYFALWHKAEVGSSRAIAAGHIFSQVWGNQEAPHEG